MASSAKASDRPTVPLWAAMSLVLAGIAYNAVLAIVNAHVTSLTMTQVASCEFAILLLVVITIARTGLRPTDSLPIALGAVFFLGALILSFVNGQLVVEALRNCAIIVLFTMLGMRCEARTVRIVFTAAVGLVLAVMLFELLTVDTYVALFQPQSYFLNTRGIGEDAVDQNGLFPNAMGFSGRFSFGLFSSPRTSSIFLEQTSLANFASVAAVYLVTLWRSLSRPVRVLGVACVVLALLSNNTRMASVFAILVFAGYWAFPRLPARGTFIIPIILVVLALVMADYLGESRQDDFAGRIGLSLQMLALTDLPAALGARALEAGSFPDSGYSYILYSSSIVGALALWFYVSSVVPTGSPEQRRCGWAIALFVFINLIVAGNAVFSMKIAGLLWLLAGFMRSPHFAEIPPRRMRRAVRRPRRAIAAQGATA